MKDANYNLPFNMIASGLGDLMNRSSNGDVLDRQTQLRKQKTDMMAIFEFIPDNQKRYLAECFRTRGYEHEYAEILTRLRQTIETMPKTYEQDGKGDDAIAHLHYFAGSSDWYIMEKDAGSPDDEPEDKQSQAHGFACLNRDYLSAESGYISIRELCSCNVELDFHFKPVTLREIKAHLEAAA